MSADIDVDTLYVSFCERLPAELRTTAAQLPYVLALSPVPSVPWSGVFKNDVTLRAPELWAEAIFGVRRECVEHAVFAHMLAVIEAFGRDRIADEQVACTPELIAVLDLVREARDEALLRLGGAGAVQEARRADLRTRDAIESERRLLQARRPASFDTYERISASKQAVGLPATLWLGRVSGLDARTLRTLHEGLMGIWLGLQFQDDALDWEDDETRGGSWAAALSAKEGASGSGAAEHVRAAVWSSGVSSRLLQISAAHFGIARRAAEIVGAPSVAAWASEREDEAHAFELRERASPGYYLRFKKLAPWAREVFG